ncbi:MAG: hypothetical protein ACRDBM_03915 [Sporomusa sp.]
MKQDSYVAIIKDQTERALWEVKNVIDCIPNELWEKCYCNMPLWKHVYHMLHSLDLWFISPRDKEYKEPSIHEVGLNDLDAYSTKKLSRNDVVTYYNDIKRKIVKYLEILQDETLLQMPPNCEYTKFTLIIAQHRHLHSHMGMIMGFIINATNKWPKVIGLEGNIPAGQ